MRFACSRLRRGQKAGAALITEAPRLAGSCPMVFAWDGRGFRFVSDVLGVAPLGASSGDGGVFALDHDEYVQIPRGALAERNGRFEVRITEELHEVSYLDQVQLVALDHPSGTEIFTNEKFKSPPFPEFRLFGLRRRAYPVRATDDHGRDVLGRVLRKDRAYPDGFRRDLKEDLREGNLRFRPFSEQTFVEDMRTSRAVIANGGFTTLSESVYLHKPILSSPVRRQFEQVLNGRALEVMGYGMSAVDELTPEKLGAFLERVPEYAKNLAGYHQDGNTEILGALDQLLAGAASAEPVPEDEV